METPQRSRPAFYRPELDGLRLVAFLFVFITHAFSDDATDYIARGVPSAAAHVLSHVVHAGRYGVPLFFVLSAYLITELLIREYEYRGEIDVARFYARRALRIWPLYIAFIVGSFVVVRALDGATAFSSRYFASLLLFSGNWGMAAGLGPAPSDVATPALWSVSVEEQFYLAWPILLRIAGVRHLRTLAVAFIVVAVAVRLAMDLDGASATAFWYSTFSWLDSIGAGALLAVVLRGRVPSLRGLSRVLLFAVGVAMWGGASIVESRWPSGSAVYAMIVCGSVLVFLSAAGSRRLAHPILVYLGRISYGLYVAHVAALAMAWTLLPRLSVSGALLGLAITIGAASLSYRWLETPFLNLKKRVSYVASRPVSSGSCAPDPCCSPDRCTPSARPAAPTES